MNKSNLLATTVTLLAFQSVCNLVLCGQTLYPARELSPRAHSTSAPFASKAEPLVYPTYVTAIGKQDEHLQLIDAAAATAAATVVSIKPAEAELPLVVVATKCTPILNLQALLSKTSSVANSQDPKAAAGDAIRAGLMDKFSFAVGDIDMPVAPAEGSISSAMKLLSTFGSQFDPLGGQEQSLDDLEGGKGEHQQQQQNVVRFRGNNLQIQGLNVTMLNVHLFANDNEPKFGVGILIRNTTLTGQFTFNGPVQLAGFYRMSIDNVYLVASSNLTKQRSSTETTLNNSSAPAPAPVQVSGDSIEQHRYNLRTNDFRMNITNLGYISIDFYDSKDSNKPTTNYLLRMLQRLLQKTIKRTYYSFENYIRETLETESRRSLDCELSRFGHLLDSNSNSNSNNSAKGSFSTSSQQNDLAKILSSEIVRSHLSQVPLPDFAHQQQLFGAGATIQFYNGSLNGLENLKLNGETRIKLQDEHLFVNTSIGWSDLRPHYNWDLLIGTSRTPISRGFVLFNIKAVDFDAVITKGLKQPNTQIVVEQLIIRRLDNPKMDIGGLPGMNRVTRGMVNFFMGRLKQRIASSILPTLKLQLERSLNKMNIF